MKESKHNLNDLLPIKGNSKVVCSIMEHTTNDYFFNEIINATMEDNMEVTMEVKKLILNCKGEQSRSQLQPPTGLNGLYEINPLIKSPVIRKLRITANQYYFRKAAIKQGLLEMTIPDKANNRLTDKGLGFKTELSSNL